MGKRRNTKTNLFIMGGERETSSRGKEPTINNNKFPMFDFSEDDCRVDFDSRKILSKFTRKKSPSKKPAHTQPLDKYTFLEFFTEGTMAQQSFSGNETLDIDVRDIILEDRTFTPGVTVSAEPSKDLLVAPPNPHNVKDNTVYHIDSDEDGSVELHTSTSSDIADSKGSLVERLPQHGSHANDCEVLVVVSPKYIKYGNMYYTNRSLTFSSRDIRLGGSPLRQRKRPHRLAWPACGIVKIENQLYESVKADVVTLHLKCKDSGVDESCYRNSGIIELEFVMDDDPQWFKKQEEIKSLNLIYETAWETIVSDSSLIEHFDDIIYPERDADAVTVSKRDIERLQPATFINDTIIDFYIKYLSNETKPVERQRFHFFNTFFFRKLADMDWVEDGEAFQRVRKWTRNINLFDKDYIFIPVNSSLHWSLIVICYPGEVANLRDKDVDDLSVKPCILHMDSLRGSHKGLENLIRSYLWEEWKECNDKHDADIRTKFSNLHFDALQLPQQENLFDCGLFLLHYAELFLAQAANSSTAKNSNFLNKEWFLPAEVSLKKRDHIRKLIHRLVGDNALKDSTLVCKDKYLPSDINGGDINVKAVQESNVKETHLGTKFNSGIDHEIKGQQSFQDMLRPKNTHASVISSRRLPIEKEAVAKQATSFPVNGIRHQDYQYGNTKPPHCSPSSFRVGDIEIFIDSPEVHVPEVTSTEEKYKYSSMSSEDLADCIVEDSEEENGAERIRKTIRRSPSPIKILHLL